MLNFFNQIVYVQLSPTRLTVRNPVSRVEVSEVPEVAIAYQPKARIVAVGNEARSHRNSDSVRILNPFAHPRSMVSDFTVGEQALKAFVSRVKPKSIFVPAPRIVMHLVDDPVGGFTQVELRAFREMAIGAGARQVEVWIGRRLTDEELLSGKFPADGELCD